MAFFSPILASVR